MALAVKSSHVLQFAIGDFHPISYSKNKTPLKIKKYIYFFHYNQRLNDCKAMNTLVGKRVYTKVFCNDPSLNTHPIPSGLQPIFSLKPTHVYCLVMITIHQYDRAHNNQASVFIKSTHSVSLEKLLGINIKIIFGLANLPLYSIYSIILRR